MTARIVLIGAQALGLGEELAAAIHATHIVAPEPVGGAEVQRELAASTDGFVLEGFPRTPQQAEGLDAFLDARAASVEIALWFRTDAAPGQAEEDLLEHYRGRVVEVAAIGDDLTEDGLVERALAGVREATLSFG